MSRYTKDSNAKLDFAIDWTPWLQSGDTITTATWTVPAGITQATPAPSVTGGKATIWLEGGTVGASYAVTCRVTTTQGRIDDRTITILIRER